MRRLTLVGLLITTFVLVAAAAYAAPAPGGTFVDDNGNPHEPDIEAIAAIGVTKGCNPPVNDRYCPDRSVTRDEMASFFSRAFAIAPSGVDRFADDNGNVHEAQINGIAVAGVTLGCNPPANTNYCPLQTVTRAQMASFLARQLGLPASGTDFYTDDNGSVHEGDINAVTAAGLAVPCGQGHYCPNGPMKRDVMATMLARALSLVPIPPPPTPGTGQPDPAPDITRIKDVSNTPGYVVLIGEPVRFTDPDKDEFDFSDGTGTIEIDLKANFGPITLNTCYVVGGPGGGSEIEIRTDETPPGFVAKIGGRCPNGIDDF